MIDESFDTDQMKKPAEPWEFRVKPAWQRLIIMVAGVTVNFLLALFIYSMVLFYWGESYIQTKDMTMGMRFNSEAKALGFHDHDILLGTEKGAFADFSADFYRDLSTAREAYVLRNGKRMTIALPGDINLLSMLKSVPQFARPFIPAEIDSVLPKTPAALAGMMKGDKLTSLNGKPIDSWNEYQDQIARLGDILSSAKTHQDSMKVRTATIVFAHKATGQADTTQMVLTPELTMGVTQTSIYTYYKPTTRSYGFLESFPAGIKYGWNVLSGYVSDMKYVFSADGAKSLGGFGAIGSLFPPTWDWHSFWLMTAFLSIILAFMNILPIPALDGGHVLFLLYEMITRRKPSETFMIRAEYAGIGILLLLMIVARSEERRVGKECRSR